MLEATDMVELVSHNKLGLCSVYVRGIGNKKCCKHAHAFKKYNFERNFYLFIVSFFS